MRIDSIWYGKEKQMPVGHVCGPYLGHVWTGHLSTPQPECSEKNSYLSAPSTSAACNLLHSTFFMQRLQNHSTATTVLGTLHCSYSIVWHRRLAAITGNAQNHADPGGGQLHNKFNVHKTINILVHTSTFKADRFLNGSCVYGVIFWWMPIRLSVSVYFVARTVLKLHQNVPNCVETWIFYTKQRCDVLCNVFAELDHIKLDASKSDVKFNNYFLNVSQL